MKVTYIFCVNFIKIWPKTVTSRVLTTKCGHWKNARQLRLSSTSSGKENKKPVWNQCFYCRFIGTSALNYFLFLQEVQTEIKATWVLQGFKRLLAIDIWQLQNYILEMEKSQIIKEAVNVFNTKQSYCFKLSMNPGH